MLVTTHESLQSVDSGIREILSMLRKYHMSRIPVHAVADALSGTHVYFVDERFMDLQPNVLTVMGATKLQLEENGKYGKGYRVYSSSLTNEKYHYSHQKHRSLASSDPDKIVSILRKCTGSMPATGLHKTTEKINIHIINTWRDVFKSDLSAAINKVSMYDSFIQTLMVDISNYRNGTAAPYSNDVFHTIFSDKNIATYAEHYRRRKVDMPTHNVVVHPAEVVVNNLVVSGLAELSVDKQEAIGMLKLVENLTFVEGVGTRINENNFWIY
jgi:hypothetical protein